MKKNPPAAARTSRDRTPRPAADDAGLVAEQVSMQYLERIRAIEFARLELERRLERADRAQLELSTDLQERTAASAEQVRQANEMLARAQAAHTHAMRTEAERHEEIEAQLRQRLTLFENDAALSSGLVRSLEQRLKELQGRHDALEKLHAEGTKELGERRARIEGLLKEQAAQSRALDAASAEAEARQAELRQAHERLEEMARQEAALTERLQGTRKAHEIKLAELEERLATAFKNAGRNDSERAALQERLDGSRKAHEAKLAELEQRLAVALTNAGRNDSERVALQERLDGSRQAHELKLAGLEERLAVALRNVGRHESERSALLERIEGSRKAHAAKMAEVEKRLAATLQNLGRREEALRSERSTVARLEGRIEHANTQQSELQSALQETRLLLDERETALVQMQEQANELHGRLARLEGSTSLGLGMAITSALSSWHGFVRLPVRVWRLGRQALARRPGPADEPVEIDYEQIIEQAVQQLASQPPAAAQAWLATQALPPHMHAHGLTQLAKACLTAWPEQALQLGEAAQALDPRDYRAKWLAFMRFDAGQIRSAAQALEQLPKDTSYRASERFKATQILGCARLLESLPDIPAAAAAADYMPEAGRVLYVAASAIPFHQSGYTLRTQSLLSSLAAAGVDVVCATRPGYPGDRIDALASDVGEQWQVGAVPYVRTASPDRRRELGDAYLQKAADALCGLARTLRPAAIHAASNHENALPALLAARRLGLPFVYEVRGLWELTAATKQAGWEASERFELEYRLECLVARHADSVLTLNQGLADELVARGVDRARIRLAPNAIDPDFHRPHPRDPALAERLGLSQARFVAGYAGSLVGYEGLDDLVSALASLSAQLPDLHLLIIGDGEQRAALESQALRLGVADRVHFTGRIAAVDVPSHLAQCDCVVLPRKPLPVCERVMPIKPLEAMAMGVPVIVSGVGPLRELVEQGVTGLIHEPGDPDSLAAAILQLAQDGELGARLARDARERVVSSATWSRVAERVASLYHDLVPGFRQQTPALAQPIPIEPSRNTLTADEKQALDHVLSLAYSQGGAAAVARLLDAQTQGHNDRFYAFCALKAAACCHAAGDCETAAGMLDEAVRRSPEATTLKGAATLHFNAGDDQRALALVEQLERKGATDESVARIARQVRSRIALCEQAARPRSEPQIAVEARRSVNFLHFSLPYTSVGYSTRSHGIAQGVQAAGWDIRPCTRPGFPHDFKPELEGQELPERDLIDGVSYRRLFDGGRLGLSETEYLMAAVDRCEQVLRDERPAIVHAASNYSTALPALIAARRLGLPFVYEVRGFWEVTRSSRDAEFEKTTKFRAMQMLESLVLQHADQVITITGAMREDLIGRGVPPERISLAYNSVDPERFVPAPRDRELAARLGIPEGVPVIGYIGSFVDYEGLDDLVLAAAMLRREGLDFRLLMVGDGAAMPQLQAMIAAEALADVAILTGRIPHEEVEAHYSLVDIAPFPRKPWQVCELVSPLKPFEAMAMEKAVVVSGTRALVEIVQDGHNGLVFRKGEPAALAATLKRLVGDAELRAQLGRQAREWVREHRSWRRAGTDVVAAYDAVMARSPN